jgi:hypothetical protein
LRIRGKFAHLCFINRLDVRTGKGVEKPCMIHKKGTKIVSLHCNPVDPDVFITAGNDHMVICSTNRFSGSSKLEATSTVNSKLILFGSLTCTVV